MYIWASSPAAGPPTLIRRFCDVFLIGVWVPGAIPLHPEGFFIEFAAKHVENGQLWPEKLLRLYRKLIFSPYLKLFLEIPQWADPVWETSVS